MDGATCNQCLKGYVLKNNKCILTPMSGCQVQEGEICKSCYEGYLLKDNACMTLPIDNCSKQVGHECQVCRDGYKLNDNQCEVKRSWKCKGDHCSTKKGKKTRSNCSPDLTCDPKCNQTWGRCANGICVCGGGYSGVSCNIPPAPVETDKEKILYKLNKKEEKQKKKDEKNRPIALSYPKHEHVKENQPFTDELKKLNSEIQEIVSIQKKQADWPKKQSRSFLPSEFLKWAETMPGLFGKKYEVPPNVKPINIDVAVDDRRKIRFKQKPEGFQPMYSEYGNLDDPSPKIMTSGLKGLGLLKEKAQYPLRNIPCKKKPYNTDDY